jgi:DNA-binding NarL/FixJ family response regulator
MSIRIVIADDHELVRLGLRALLDGTEIAIAGETDAPDKVLPLAQKLSPTAVLMDYRFDGSDGLQALGQLKADCPQIPVLIFSAFDNPHYVARAAALQAAGFLLKGAPREQLVAAIRKVSAGESIWTREALRRITSVLATPRVNSHTDAPLTQRENEVLLLLAQGLTNNEIAQSLGISYETVKEHVQHILRKIGVVDRTQAAVWAVRNNVV